jgi:predicted amidohydrolase
VRALLAAIRCEKGDVAGNLASHLRLLSGARQDGCDCALFPEMSLTGSVDPAVHPGRLIRLDHPAVAAVARATGGTGVGACFGVAERSAGGEPYITQVFAAGGRVVGAQRKRHLGQGEEAFTAGRGARVFEHAGLRFGVAICAEAARLPDWREGTLTGDIPSGDGSARPAPGQRGFGRPGVGDP